jgi:transposase-like protein
MATTQSKNGRRFDEEFKREVAFGSASGSRLLQGRRFDEEFKREVAALASRPAASDEQVGRDLGVSAWRVARGRRRFGADKEQRREDANSGCRRAGCRQPQRAATRAPDQSLAARVRGLARAIGAS